MRQYKHVAGQAHATAREVGVAERARAYTSAAARGPLVEKLLPETPAAEDLSAAAFEAFERAYLTLGIEEAGAEDEGCGAVLDSYQVGAGGAGSASRGARGVFNVLHRARMFCNVVG